MTTLRQWLRFQPYQQLKNFRQQTNLHQMPSQLVALSLVNSARSKSVHDPRLTQEMQEAQAEWLAVLSQVSLSERNQPCIQIMNLAGQMGLQLTPNDLMVLAEGLLLLRQQQNQASPQKSKQAH